MAVDRMNDSYDRCLTELRERYKYRGISHSAKSEALSQAQAEAATYASAPDAYLLFDAKSKIADSYRSGEYKGSKYMTSDDFVRYFKNRRAFYMPSVVRETEPETAKTNSAVPHRRGQTAKSGLVRSDSGKEGHLANLTSVIQAFREKWFPVERKEGREEGRKVRMPVATMSGIAVFALSLGLIVGGSVMLGHASGEVGELNTTIASLENQKNELQGKLDLKYNVDEVEEDVKSLGMIKRQYADSEYLTENREEQITIYDKGDKENIGLGSLLAAFGIELD